MYLEFANGIISFLLKENATSAHASRLIFADLLPRQQQAALVFISFQVSILLSQCVAAGVVVFGSFMVSYSERFLPLRKA